MNISFIYEVKTNNQPQEKVERKQTAVKIEEPQKRPQINQPIQPNNQGDNSNNMIVNNYNININININNEEKSASYEDLYSLANSSGKSRLSRRVVSNVNVQNIINSDNDKNMNTPNSPSTRIFVII